MSQAIEYTMTHRDGAPSDRYERPVAVREMADRVQRWVSTPEMCQHCHRLSAVAVRSGVPLCGPCRETRRLLPAAVLPTPVTRADAETADAMQLRGQAIVFNARSDDLGGFTEIIRPAAMDRTIAEGIDVRALWSHDASQTIGRLSAGTLRMRSVTRGLSVEVDPPRWAGQHLESVRRRDVTGMSFGFIALEDDWHLEDGAPVREVLDMRVHEVSGVSFPAYPQTTLRVVPGARQSAWLEEAESRERLRLASL